MLAAGKGTRMKSDLPKVLMPVCGRPMIEYVLDALAKGGVRRIIVVVGYRAELVRAAIDGRAGVEFALQTEQLGTGHAVMACRNVLADCDGPVLVVTGDAPLMQADRWPRCWPISAAAGGLRPGHGLQRQSRRLGPHPPRRGKETSSASSNNATPRPNSGGSPK